MPEEEKWNQAVRFMTVKMDVNRCKQNHYGLCHKAKPLEVDQKDVQGTLYFKCYFLVDECRCPGAEGY